MYCSACGKKCPDGAAFCAWCGARLPELDPGEAVTPEAPELPAPQPEAAAEAPEQPAPQPEIAVEAPEQPVGVKPVVSEAAGAQPEPDPLDLDEPEAAGPVSAKPADRAFQRPRVDDARTVRPLSMNPAQPLRGQEAEAAKAPQPVEPDLLDFDDDEADEAATSRAARRNRAEHGNAGRPQPPKGAVSALFGWVEGKVLKRSASGRKEQPAKHSPYERGAEQPIKRSPYEREAEQPAKRSPYEREEEKSAKRSPYEREEEKPSKRSPYAREAEQPAKRSPYDRPLKRALDLDDDLPPRAPRDRTERGKAVTASGGMVTPPARRSPGRSARAFHPQKRPRKDLFFEDLETPAENFYDEAMEERALSRRIKGIVTIALLVGALMVAIWLMWTPGGQMVRAQMNLGAPASAYKALGDQDRAGGQVQRAADAYYSALKLDSQNYGYALLVGQTQAMVGTDESRKKAAKAYGLCIQLKPQEVQPYKELVDLYNVMGDYEAAEACRAEGYKQTGDASLAASN